MTKPRNIAPFANLAKRRVPSAKRFRHSSNSRHGEFLPPEDWHEDTGGDYQIIAQEPGKGYCHAVTAVEIRQRLSELPAWMLEPIGVIQLSRMTRKKQTFPCYGMQWGSSLYLYPIEESLVEVFHRPPKTAVFNEARMFGGRWEQVGTSAWELRWSEAALRDFYLNNILIHELGHLLDQRNTNYWDRERYAEWFALEYGYKPSRRKSMAREAARRTCRRRHHGC